MLREVEKLNLRNFEVVVGQSQTYELDERPLQPIIVGQETMLEKAWKHLVEDGVGIMGIYGMGGVGKTTLLTQLNNKFSSLRCGTFDFVIWVLVSRELQVEKIQDHIAEKLGLRERGWNEKEKSEKAILLYNCLRKKKFVLFLDDIWEEVDLVKIGVPFPTTQNRCKVAFTTRSQDVCAHMGVENPMEVQCLTEDDSYDLFQKKVGQITLGSHPEIPDLARIVARKCCGLPLALDVIGKTMSCKRTVQEWHHAIDVLNSYAREFSGMIDKILPLLKYSYDNLKGEHVKSCLLYCSLFPEDYEIPKAKLIDYWICEGFVDGSEGLERAENKAHEIICNLVRASLLIDEGEIDIVRMHDVIREMALWIANDFGREKEAFIVHAGVGLERAKVNNWNDVRRMSLMFNKNNCLDGSPECSELTTLLLQETNLKNISREFFKIMPKLAVLDLSYYQNPNICAFELHGISELVSLQYLNLSKTGLRYLPKGLQELKKLIHLDLEFTYKLKSIAGVSSLHNLKVLKLIGSRCSQELNTVQELETMEHLESLTMGIEHPRVLNILSSDRLTSCTRALKIKNIHMESSGISILDKLGELSIMDSTIPEIKMGISFNPRYNPRNLCFSSLFKVVIQVFKRLSELTFLMFAPNLRDLAVRGAYELEDIINKEKALQGENSGIVPFPNLIRLDLSFLPKLKSIYWSPLPFPCLKRIDVIKCPNLRKLPLDSQSGKPCENGLIIIYREKEWIDSVEWEDEATKTRFLSSCEKY